ncbi:hypothetical protein FRC02_002473 [Tulasnella sp. 418]|nr:hypothetical protein FRC02_002473 [Tulasnella sp. 418]
MSAPAASSFATTSSDQEARPATKFADFTPVSHIEQPAKPSRPTPLMTQEQMDQWMSQHLTPQGWQISQVQDSSTQEISKTFKLKKYKDCVQFVVDIADLARREQHHPVITLKMGSVTVATHTHRAFDTLRGVDENVPGLTHFDVRLALQIETVYDAYTKSNAAPS